MKPEPECHIIYSSGNWWTNGYHPINICNFLWHSWDAIPQLLPNQKLFMRAIEMVLEKEIIVGCALCTLLDYTYCSLKRSMVWSLDGIKNQLTTKYLRSVFIIMLFVCAINPFLVICQYAEEFIISFFLFLAFAFDFPLFAVANIQKCENTEIVRESSILMQIISHNTKTISIAYGRTIRDSYF